MIKFENTEVVGFRDSIRGMRNPMNSWKKSDSGCRPVRIPPFNDYEIKFVVGENDLDLMKRLRTAGKDHRKYLRMIDVYVDITAPLYWWKEFKTYTKGRIFLDDELDALEESLQFDSTDVEPHIVMNSCSTMHKIHSKEFTLDDFSIEHLYADPFDGMSPASIFSDLIEVLNENRKKFIETKNKVYWWQMIQLLPSSYNQKRTVMLNYEVLNNMYHARKNHKLDEWRVGFVDWVNTLPHAKELIVGEE